MNPLDLQQYLPQRTFLIQGSEDLYDTLLGSIMVHDKFLFSLSVPRLTIDHARTIVSFIHEGTGEERNCLVYFSLFSPDAAQVLLKALEEPDLNTTIIFVTSYPYLVPQTIRSRVMLIGTQSAVSTTLPVSTKAAALTYIKKEFDADNEDASVRRAKAIQFLDALEEKAKINADKARALYEAKHMLFSANMPTKYVLEYAVSMVL